MRIACPTCGAAYDVPPDRVPPGRPVKCARCASSWTPVLQAADPPAAMTLPAPNVIERMGTVMPGGVIPDPAPPDLPEEPAFDEVPGPLPPARTVASARNSPLLAAAWLLTILVLAGLAWTALSRRAEIMRAWPPSQRAYAAIGLAHPDEATKPAAPK